MGKMAAGVTDPKESAKLVGLRYVSDAGAGIHRKKSGNNFQFFDAQEKLISNPIILRRIKSLVIPPAWTEVWICPNENGHCKPPAGTLADANNTAITHVGATFATKTNTRG